MVTLLHPTLAPPPPEQGRPPASLAPWGVGAALWALGYALINATAGLASNAQLWWQVRQGGLSLSTGHAVLASSWSWTAGDVSWVPNSWGWGVLLALAYRIGGIGGVVDFTLLVQLAILWLAWHVLGRVGLRGGGVRLAALVVLSVSMTGWADGQAELSDYAAVFAFAAVCLSARVNCLSTGPRVGVLAVAAFAIAALWENLHLGGLVSIVLFAAVALLCLPRRGWRELVSVAVGAAVGVLATPAGASGIAKSLDTASKSEAEHYAAWGPIFAQPASYNYGPAVLAVAIGAAAVVLVISRRDWLAAAVLALAAVATCLVVRSGSDLVMLSMLAGGAALARLWPEGRMPWLERMPRLRLPRLRVGVVAGVVAAGAAWLIVGVLVAAASVSPSWRLVGVDPSDLAPVPAGARIFSTIHASDAIDVLRPDLQVTMDSRNDLYPVGEFEFAESLTGAGASQAAAWFAKHDVTAVYLPGPAARESRAPLAEQLTDAGWRSYPGVDGLVLLSGSSAVG